MENKSDHPTEPICDCGVCNTCLHPWHNYPTTYADVSGPSRLRVLLGQYRKALTHFGVTFADNGLIRKIPRHTACPECEEATDGK
jgi:hypothetical protein